jgi:hypothetical protein
VTAEPEPDDPAEAPAAPPDPRGYRLGACVLYVDAREGYVSIHFAGGARAEARPWVRGAPWCSEEQADAYAATAALLGYGDGDAELHRASREHELLHTYASVVLLSRPESPTLRAAAGGPPVHPTRHGDAQGFEERLVQSLQLFLNTGRETEPLSLLWWLGRDPDDLEDRLRRWLAGEGWHEAAT